MYQTLTPVPASHRNSTAPCTITRLAGTDPASVLPRTVPTGQQQYTLLWIQQGSGQLLLDADRLPIQPQHIYCLRPGQRIQQNIHTPLEGWQITFRKEFLDLFEKGAASFVHGVLLHHFCGRPAISVPHTLAVMLNAMLHTMQQEQAGQHPLRLEVMRNLLRIFIIYICRHCEAVAHPPGNTRRADMVSYFFNLVDQHFTNRKKVSEYATLLGITPNYLNAIVREESGFSPSYHIQQRIVLEAKRQALFQRDSMKEIAYALGFCNPAHFSKYFKSSTGVNFTQFKRSA